MAKFPCVTRSLRTSRAGGATILIDRGKQIAGGGFDWWDRLPPSHAGEDVVVQFPMLNLHEGPGILPSSTFHLGLPINVPIRNRNAMALLALLLAQVNERQMA